MFDIRTTPLAQGEAPWKWGIDSERQCTWYVYWRVFQVFGVYPCYYDRAKKIEGYTNAKEWMENFREPFQPYYFSDNPNLEVQAGDVLIFDGNYGHVVFVETMEDYNHAFISQYNLAAPLTFSNDTWTRGQILKGNPYNTGKPLGILRYTKKEVYPVSRNEYVNQVEALDNTLRVRLAPSLDGEYYCNIKLGYYNVLDTQESDGYTWYEIEEGKWCAQVISEVDGETRYTLKYLPAIDVETDKLVKENKALREALAQISQICDKLL